MSPSTISGLAQDPVSSASCFALRQAQCSYSARIQLGMTGFDIVIYSCCLFLFGIAAVPVTHTLHTISAKSDILAKARTFFEGLRFPALVPAYA